MRHFGKFLPYKFHKDNLTNTKKRFPICRSLSPLLLLLVISVFPSVADSLTIYHYKTYQVSGTQFFCYRDFYRSYIVDACNNILVAEEPATGANTVCYYPCDHPYCPIGGEGWRCFGASCEPYNANLIAVHIGGCNGASSFCSTSSQYQQASAFDAKYSDVAQWWYFTTTSGGTEYKCISYYVDTQGDAWEVTVGAYDTVNPVNNPNCMTKTAFDARNNTDCTHAPNANDTCTTAQYGIPGATTETDECVSGVGDDKGQTGCSN